MNARHLPIERTQRKDYTVADRVNCPRLEHPALTEYCKKCRYLHFTVEDNYVKCAYGI